ETRQNLVQRHNHAPAVLKLRQYLARQDFLRQDAPLALARQDARAQRRQFLLELLVDVLLEPQTALQAAAAAGYLRGIERGLLQLGHPHRDRRHGAHVRVAANRLAAVTVVRQQLGLVADTDLAHFDAGLVFPSQVLDQVAEIDPLLRQEVEHDAFAAEQ